MPKDPINILIISHSGDSGGAESSLLDLLRNINRDKFNPIVIIPHPGPMADKLKEINILFYCRFIDHWIPLAKAFGVKHSVNFLKSLRGRIWSISHLIENHNIDIIYTNTILPLDGALAAKKHGIPHIWHIREYPIGNKDIKRYFPWPHIIVNYLSSHIITNSKNLKLKIKSKLISRPISVIYNGVTKNDNNQPFFEKQIPLDKKIITTVCAITPRKDLKTFLLAAKILTTIRKDISFLIVGTGEPSYIQELKFLIESYNIAPFINFMGQRKDAIDIMKKSNVVTLTSTQEAFGRVIIEAMSVGTPVISTSSGGPSEIIENEVDGFLIPIGDAKALASIINKILDNPEISKKISDNGIKKSSKIFNIENYVKSIESIITTTYSSSKN
ncbi:MAG: glycosyltransferase [Methyloprofundus sp.]|nr:glycosyltransferase [Methyloprofundus sp.]